MSQKQNYSNFKQNESNVKQNQPNFVLAKVYTLIEKTSSVRLAILKKN